MKVEEITIKVARVLLALIGLGSGFFAGLALDRHFLAPMNILAGVYALHVGFALLVALVCALIGIIIARPLANALIRGARWLESRLSKVPFSGLISGTIGLIAGLIVAVLISSAVKSLPLIGPYMPVLITLLLGYLGASVGYHWRGLVVGLIENALPSKRGERRLRRDVKEGVDLAPELLDGTLGGALPKVLDTSVIIDGRIVDIARAGFLEGPLVIPQFMLDELRHIADSGDALKRNRGRRGLDMLNALQTLDVGVVTVTRDYEQIQEVDAKLVQLAKDLGGCVVTNDFNLNKVASFQKVRVLNVNELAGVIKTVVLPGEEMNVEIVARGKEADQGVGYLDDGTMIVVENGRKHIGESVQVVVTSVIQTNAGRMIFVRMEG